MRTVSVIIPCYQYGPFLEGCAGSVLAQQGVAVKVLIIDDASTDNTAEVAEALAARDTRVEVRHHETNCGHIFTYNEGLDWAEGDYTLLLSADDMLTPGALARAARLMDCHPEVGFVYGEVIHFDGEGEPDHSCPEDGQCGWQLIPGREFLTQICESTYNPVPTPTAVVRTDLQKRIGGYRYDLPHTADLELWLRFAVESSVGVLNAHQAYQRRHVRSMNRGYRGVKDFRQRLEAFETLFREQGAQISDGDKLREMSIRRLAEAAFWEASLAFERGESEACQELLGICLHLDPSSAFRPEWARMRWKQRLGPTVWGIVQPLVGRVRARMSSRKSV